MSPILIVFTISVFVVPSSFQHFLNDVDSGSSELFEADSSAEKLRPSPKSQLEIDPESKTPKHVFKSIGRQRRSVTSMFQTANNNAANFLSQQHAGATYLNRPLDSSWNQNRITNKLPSGEVFSYPSEPLVAAKPKVATEAINLHTFLGPKNGQSIHGSSVFKAPEIRPESYVDRLFNDDQNVKSPGSRQGNLLSATSSYSDATIKLQSPSELQTYFDSKNGHEFDFKSNGFSNNNPGSILQPAVRNTPIAQSIQRPVRVSEQEFFGTPAQDFAGASDLLEHLQNVKNGVRLDSSPSYTSEQVQNTPQFHQEYFPTEKSPISYKYSAPIHPESGRSPILPDERTSYSQSVQTSSSSEEKIDDAVIQQLPIQKAKREEEHHTDPGSQNDLGLATSLLHHEKKGAASGLHDTVPHHPFEQEALKKIDDEPTIKQYQSYYTSYNPYHNQAYQPYDFHNSRVYVGSDYGANYQVNPGYKVNVYKEEVASPSQTLVNDYDLYWGAVDDHKVSSHESYKGVEEKPEYSIGAPELDNKYLRRKLLRKLVKKPKKSKCCGKTLGKKMKGKEVEEESEYKEDSKEQKKKLRGFARLLDTIMRIVPDDLVDRIMNRSWDRLYRNHKNCWHYNDV